MLRKMSVLELQDQRTRQWLNSPRILRIFLSLALSLFFWALLVSFGLASFYLLPTLKAIQFPHWQHRLFSFQTPYDDSLADFDAYNKSWHRPDVHVLVDARVKDLGLCRTLLSVVIQGYPPPMLIGYHNDTNLGNVVDLFNTVRNTIMKPPTREDDIIVWLGRNNWVQLPIEVTVRRYLQYADVMASRLDKQHRSQKQGLSETSGESEANCRRKPLVLFPASKVCLYNCDSDVMPESSLPQDVYGAIPEQHQCTDKKRPRYLSSGAFIGRANNVVASLTAMIDQLEDNHNGSSSSTIDEQQSWSRLFYQQELQRSVNKKQFWFREVISDLLQPMKAHTNSSTTTHNHDHNGLSLDYESHIFQTVHYSIADIRFQSTHLHLPPELRHQTILTNLSWHHLPLATNILPPHPSVPSILGLHETPHLVDIWWKEMWFYPYSTELLGRYRYPDRAEIAKEAEGGGTEWWNLRGGGGGFWTDRGGWVSWEGVCGGFERGLFGENGGSGKEDGGEGEEGEQVV